MWIVCLVGASCVIQVIEYLNRHYGATWVQTLMITGPLIVIAQFGLYYGWKYAPHVMLGWALFSLTNNIARLGVVHYFYRDQLTFWHIVGTLCMVIGMWCIVKAH